MIIKNLKNTAFQTIIDCFLNSFENYFVEMPIEKNYYKQRWDSAKVDYNLSYGMFENEKLIGFIINAIDVRRAIKTAYNTGTGVLPAYRGKRIIKSIYEYALVDLKKNGIKTCSLEVIIENNKAIKSYKSIGFKVCKILHCYKGSINLINTEKAELKKVNFDTFDWNSLPNQESYSWNFQTKSIKNGDYDYYQVIKDKAIESYFVINQKNGTLAQFEVLNKNEGNWNRLFNEIKQVSTTIKINNIDSRLNEKIDFINSLKLTNTVNQYGMELSL